MQRSEASMPMLLCYENLGVLWRTVLENQSLSYVDVVGDLVVCMDNYAALTILRIHDGRVMKTYDGEKVHDFLGVELEVGNFTHAIGLSRSAS